MSSISRSGAELDRANSLTHTIRIEMQITRKQTPDQRFHFNIKQTRSTRLSSANYPGKSHTITSFNLCFYFRGNGVFFFFKSDRRGILDTQKATIMLLLKI